MKAQNHENFDKQLFLCGFFKSFWVVSIKFSVEKKFDKNFCGQNPSSEKIICSVVLGIYHNLQYQKKVRVFLVVFKNFWKYFSKYQEWPALKWSKNSISANFDFETFPFLGPTTWRKRVMDHKFLLQFLGKFDYIAKLELLGS